jgi:hypothetical protein
MSYTEFALHTLAAALTFALAAFVARRSKSDARGMLAAVVIGLTLNYNLGVAISFIAMFWPLGHIDFLVLGWLKQIGLLK